MELDMVADMEEDKVDENNKVVDMACLLSFASLFCKNSNAFFFNLDKMDSE